MPKIKIFTILGARPQFIKAGTVSRAISKNDNAIEVIVHTGQHYDSNMSDVFFKQMQIPEPDYNLGVRSSLHGDMTAAMLKGIEDVLLKEMPDIVLIYGDTNSTLAGALAASKLHIPVAHVEAGLRSFNMRMPEEINRILTDRVSHILFAPTDTAINNLEREGYPNRIIGELTQKVVRSGDVMFDGALFYRDQSQKPLTKLPEEGFVLSTVHRAENTDDESRLRNIVEAINEISHNEAVILPLHPRTRKKIFEANLSFEPQRGEKGVYIIDPVGYLEMVYLLDRASIVMTDSGGLQKEAFFFEKPLIVLRDETEWVELVENGYSALVGASHEAIVEVYRNQKYNHDYSIDLYGDGKAAERIVKELVD